MDLFKIKETLRTLSGRYDLVDDDTTNVLDDLINQASRSLDRLGENQKTWGVHFEQAAVDAFKVDIPFCRAVKEVWISSTTARWQLEKMNNQDIIREYLAGDTVDSGSPESYSPVITRRIPEGTDISAFSSYLTYMDTSTDLDYDFNAVVILPPTDAIVLVEVRGLFYSKELVNDTDENYWSVVHPLTLIKATLREIEIFNQNEGKKKQWDQALAEDLLGINKDLVEELISEVDQIDN